MKLGTKVEKANRVEAYWQAVPDNNEAAARSVAKKFRLKFATYVLITEDGATTRKMRANGYAVLHGVAMSHGATADVIYSV